MAVNVVIPLLIPLEENLHNATRLLSGGAGAGGLQFSEPRYCLLLAEDSPPGLRLLHVSASNKDGVAVRYSISAGNRDGLFTIDQRSGLITLAASLDYHLHAKHELVVAAEAEGREVHAIVHVSVVDVNDKEPHFLKEDLQVSVVEEEDKHLPAAIAKAEASDQDTVDEEGLVYSLAGDGVDGHSPGDAFFSINPHTGELLQLRAVDRDPPLGRDTWRLKVQVRDGQRMSPSLAAVSRASRRLRVTQGHSQDPGASRVTQGQDDHSQDSGASGELGLVSQDPDVPQGPALMPSVSTQSHNVQSHDLEMAGQDRDSLWKDARAPGARHYLPRDPLMPPDVLLPQQGKGIFKVNNKRKEEVQMRTYDSDKILYHVDKRDEINEKTGRRSSRAEEDVLSSSQLQMEKSEFTQRWRTAERRKKLRDKNHRRAKEGTSANERYKILAGRKAFGVGTKRLVSPDITSRTSYGPQARPRKLHPKLAPARRGGGETPGFTRVSGDQFRRPRPLRLRYLTHRKRQPIAVQRRLLSVGNVIKSKPSNRGLGDDGRKESNNFTVEFEDLTDSGHIDGPETRRDEQHLCVLGPRGASASGNGPDSPRCSRGDTETSEASISKREVDQLMAKQKQPSEDPRYIRRLEADGGGCWGLGAFSVETEKARHLAQEYLSQMRREVVHVAETEVTVLVKDVNDNAPVFPNVTMYGHAQENGPIDLSAGVVWAWDADDEEEAAHARLTYSIQKNVVEERSGRAIFAVDAETGLVRTAVCCLDRETTPQYHLQVLATDGGGLQGTGTVVVRLVDVNDNSPHLTRDLWQVEVDETWGEGPPSNDTLLVITTEDSDTSNYFFYRIVEESGWGWQHFGMRTQGTLGQLFARQTLDYEDAAHRRGFRFMVQVTDRGRGGWGDSRHTDTAWVEVRLRDVNDNPPQFRRPNAHVTVREDAAPGTLLASLPATDPDMINQQQVHYHVEGGWGALSVDTVGGVRLWHTLDREAPGGVMGIARVVAMDDGHPSLSSTATLTITVTDVNDCPPRLQPPTILHVTEGAPASLLGVLTATDDDVWELGHGPPFNFTLALSNPTHILDALSIKYYTSLDSGRGGAEVWTLGPVDREEHRQLAAEVVVADAGQLATTHPITIIIDDVNDNPMRPATKTVYLWKTQGGGVDVALGRVYVEDPDDWDLHDKTFAWAGPPHPLFTLQPNTGDIFASTQLREGRYELHFSVSDRVWGQKDVAAKVTVVVRYLSPEALAHAIPLTLTPTTPAALATGWTPTQGGGGLGTLTEALMEVVGRAAEAVEIISVYGISSPSSFSIHSYPRPTSLAVPALLAPQPLSCVWLSMRKLDGNYMDPVKLHGLLALNLQHVEKVMNLRVVVDDTHTIKGENNEAASGSPISSLLDTTSPQNVASLASVALPLQVVDTNLTSLVTPRLTRAHDCHTHTRYGDETCTPTSCLNGGRCVRTDNGNRCVCPGGSWGLRCKILARTFSGAGWAWVRPLPPCLPITLSLRLLTHSPNALILYSGPLSSTVSHIHYPPMPMMALQLVDGQPQVLLEGARGPLKLQVNTTLNTGTWHTLHLHFNIQGVTLMVDMCGHGWKFNTSSDAHCIARAPWKDTYVTEGWASSLPLQLGGVAHKSLHSADFGWSNTLVHQALDGCISHLTVNGELVDLGEPAYSSGSTRGCRPQEIACGYGLASCGLQGHCVAGLHYPKCSCQPGWTGPQCTTATVPVSFGQASYMKVALSFTPDPYEVTLQLRVRARGHPDGLLVQLAASQQSCALELHLRGGVACASVSGAEWPVQEVCVEGYPLGDGSWHIIQVGRHGHNLVISVDDGDGWRQNETLSSLLTSTTNSGDMQAVIAAPPLPLTIDKQNGVTLGGIQEFKGLHLVAVHDDFQDSCVDDLRVSGHSLPLAPSVNRTNWGQVTVQQNLEQGCPALERCANTTCLPPLSCRNSWRHASCSCGPGQQLVGVSCLDLDECMFQPCLHGGTCYDLRPGYYCVCGPSHTGDNCEWAKQPPNMQPLTAPMAIALVTLSVLLIAVIAVLLNICLQRSRAARCVAVRPRGVEGLTGALETPVAALCTGSALETPMEAQAVIENPQTPKAKEENVMLNSLKIKLANKQIALTPKGAKHLVNALRPSTFGDQAIKEVSQVLPGSTTKFPGSEEDKSRLKTNPRRCSLVATATATGGVVLEHRTSILANPRRFSIAAVTATTEGVALEQRRSIPQMLCSLKTCTTTTACPATTVGVQQVIISPRVRSKQSVLAQDDLRAYAYEGEGSPSGSFTSTISGLQTDLLEDSSIRPLVPEYDEVLNLLKNLPDAVNISAQNQGSSDIITKVEKLVLGSKSPKAKQMGANIT